MFLNNSNQHIFENGGKISEISNEHKPYFLLRWDTLSDKARTDLEKYSLSNSDIVGMGKPEYYQSFVNFTTTTRKNVQVRKIFCRHPSVVPDVSDDLFLRYNKHGAEVYQFDIPYRTLLLLESCASGRPERFMFNTNGKEETLKILTYDIEALKSGEICIIGYSSFEIIVESIFDIQTETSHFNIVKYPHWEDINVVQIRFIPEEEATGLLMFANVVMEHDIVCGHNILVYDNKEIADRIKHHKKIGSFTSEQTDTIDKFLKVYTQDINIFNFGKQEKGVLIYPNSLDTLKAAQRLYTNLEQYDLKFLAKEFNFIIKDRVYFDAEDFAQADKKIFENEDLLKKFIIYNKHDVMEQNALSIMLLQQVLPLSFLTSTALDEVVIKSNTKIGDNITIVRCIHNKRIFPPMLKAQSVCQKLFEKFDQLYLGETNIKQLDFSSGKELFKVAKYGSEAPLFVYHPGLILTGETVGGLTMHPNDDGGSLPSADAHLLPWFNVIQPDVSSMYPNLVLAKNASADSIRFALKGEEPDDFIWIKDFTIDYQNVTDSCPYIIKRVSEEYQTTGIEFGVIINEKQGMLATALGGIIKLTTKIKQEKKNEKDKDELVAIKGLYASVKAARNALTHGMVLAFTVSCRSSNLTSGSLIVTYSNKVMYDIYKNLKELE